MKDLIIAVVSYFLGASSMYFILNVKKIKNKIQIVGNSNSVMNGINDEIK